MPNKPDGRELDAAHELLAHLATEHGLSNLRHGDRPGQVIADVASGRTYFNVVAFELDVQGRMGWRPEVVPASAPAAKPGRSVGSADTTAA